MVAALTAPSCFAVSIAMQRNALAVEQNELCSGYQLSLMQFDRASIGDARFVASRAESAKVARDSCVPSTAMVSIILDGSELSAHTLLLVGETAAVRKRPALLTLHGLHLLWWRLGLQMAWPPILAAQSSRRSSWMWSQASHLSG